jgi:hypothetical protein
VPDAAALIHLSLRRRRESVSLEISSRREDRAK